MKKCPICGKEHNKVRDFCSNECKKEYDKIEEQKKQEIIRDQGGFLCKICNTYTHAMDVHLRKHKISLDDYNKKYDDDAKPRSEYILKQVIEAGFKSGKDNPAYKHKGVYSIFSENYKFKDTIDVEKSKQKAIQSRKDHPENNPAKMEYWLKVTDNDQEEAERRYKQYHNKFSLEKCIEKYGLEGGIQRMYERNQKWIETMKKNSNKE